MNLMVYVFVLYAVFTAVIICRVIHISANALNEDNLSLRKSRTPLYSPIISFLNDIFSISTKLKNTLLPLL